MARNKKSGGAGKVSRSKKVKAAIASEQVTWFNKRRLAFGFLFLVILFILLAYRLAYWQVVRADDLRERATLMQRVDTQLDPIRGTIYDANMKPLARTVTKYELYAYTQYLYKDSSVQYTQKQKIVSGLAEITGQKETDIRRLLTGDENLVKIATGLDQDQITAAQELCGDNVVVKTVVKRSYPNGNYASHVVGTVNDENSGRIGLELQYNSVLAGVKGRVVRTTDSQGNTLSLGSTKYYPAKDGYSIVTTIDTVIQSYVEEELAAGMKKYGAESIACIVMEPKTGRILAMARTPGFDPNDPGQPVDKEEREKFNKMTLQEQSDYLSRMWTNTSISSLYEPGSTFKLICSSSGLDSGVVDLNTHFNCPGWTVVDGISISCADGHVHGDQDLNLAVANSCNVALSSVALDMGAEEYYKYIKLYGYTDYTNIDLPGEAMSIIKDVDDMTTVDLATTGFGQGIAITPIQMITAVSAIANDGVLMQPRIVDRIIDKDGNVIEEKQNVTVRQVISKEVSDQMKDIMLYSVREGGGTEAYRAGYRIGGKTGTAEVPDENGGYSGDRISSFVGVAPMDDPQIAVIVIVTKPTKGVSLHGAYNAAPMVGNIIEKSLVYMGVDRVFSSDEEQNTVEKDITVPDVVGFTYDDAKYNIELYGLKVKVEPETTSGDFRVVDQYPKAGDKVARGTTVYIYSE